MTDWGTPYHDSIEHFRRDLLVSAAAFEADSKRYLEPIMVASEKDRQADGDTHRRQVPAVVRDAHAASLMAYGYGYTVAALIRFAEQRFGRGVAHALACKADDILTNGDFDELNADVEAPTREDR